MSDIPRLHLLLLHSAEFSNLDNVAASAVEKGLRTAAPRAVAPTLLAGWAAAGAAPMLRLPGPPVDYVKLVPGDANWTVANRTEYMRQQARLIDPTYDIAATESNYCEMCTETKHCDSTCKDIVMANGTPLTVTFSHEGTNYAAKLVFMLEWQSA